MGKQLSQDDISYDSNDFWWFMLAYMQGGDNEKELNLNEALGEAIGEPKGPKGSVEWHAQFCPKNDQDEDGIMGSPNEIVGTLTDKLSYAIEFHAAEIRYYINDIYIGNMGGEFEAWFFTWSELQAFDRWPYLFLLMLPMVGVEECQREEAQRVIAEHLRKLSLFEECADYAAKCMLNGLVMQSAKGLLKKEKTEERVGFSRKSGIGLVNNEIHSVRNVELYPRYFEDVKAINAALNELHKLHQRFMDVVGKIGIKGKPIFYSTPYGIRFEIGGNEEIFLPDNNGINPDYINKAFARAKTLYDHLPYKPDLLRIDTYPDKEITAQSAMLQALKNMGLPDPDEVVRDVIHDDDCYRKEELYWDLGKCVLPIDKLLMGIIQSDLEGLQGLTSSVYFLNAEHFVLFHLYDDRGADIVAADKTELLQLYKKYDSWILDYDKEKIDLLFKQYIEWLP